MIKTQGWAQANIRIKPTEYKNLNSASEYDRIDKTD